MPLSTYGRLHIAKNIRLFFRTIYSDLGYLSEAGPCIH